MICLHSRTKSRSRLFRGWTICDLDRLIVGCEAFGLCVANVHCLKEPAFDVLKCSVQIRPVVLVERNSSSRMVDFRFDRCDYEMDSVFCAGKNNCSVAWKCCQVVDFRPIEYIAPFQKLDDFGQLNILGHRISREFRSRKGFNFFDRSHYVTSSCTEAKRCSYRAQFRSVQFVLQFLLVLPASKSKGDDDCSAGASRNYPVYSDTHGVYVHPYRCTWPFEQAPDKLRRQTPEHKRQQSRSTVFNRGARGIPVLHFFPVFDFRAIVARPVEDA